MLGGHLWWSPCLSGSRKIASKSFALFRRSTSFFSDFQLIRIFCFLMWTGVPLSSPHILLIIQPSWAWRADFNSLSVDDVTTNQLTGYIHKLFVKVNKIACEVFSNFMRNYREIFCRKLLVFNISKKKYFIENRKEKNETVKEKVKLNKQNLNFFKL